MQLRKVCNHPDLFEVRPIVTSFAMPRSAIADYEIKELLIRRRFLQDEEQIPNMDLFGLKFVGGQNTSWIAATEAKQLDATKKLPFYAEVAGEPPPKDTRTITGFRAYTAWRQRADKISYWKHVAYVNALRFQQPLVYSSELLDFLQRGHSPLSTSDSPLSLSHDRVRTTSLMVKSYITRAEDMASVIDTFAVMTPPVVANDLPRLAMAGAETVLQQQPLELDALLHRPAVKLQIAFPDPSLLQYDCGKLQELNRLLREKKAGGHRVLIFTQMTRILDILEIFLNYHGYLYLRLDGATKIEDRQYITERFNADTRVFCFIASSRSGGVGIK
jgi:helicase SWR1